MTCYSKNLVFSILALAAGLSTANAEARDMGMWRGEIYKDLTERPLGTDHEATAEAIDDADFEFVVVDVEVGDVSELRERSQALAKAGSAAILIPMWEGFTNFNVKTGGSLSEWQDDLVRVLEDIQSIQESENPNIVFFGIHELHKDLCYPGNSNECMQPIDVKQITQVVNDFGLQHLAYVPADERAMMHLDESVMVGAQSTARRRAGETISVSGTMTLPFKPLKTTMSFDWIANSPRQDLAVSVSLDAGSIGSEVTVWDSGDLKHVESAHSETLALNAAMNGMSTGDLANFRFVVTTDQTQSEILKVVFNNVNVHMEGFVVKYRWEVDTSGWFPTFQRTSYLAWDTVDFDITPNLNNFQNSQSNISSQVYMKNTSSMVIADVVDGVISVLPGSDALDDATYSDDPSAPSRVFTWMNNALDSAQPRFAIVRGLDTNGWSQSGWYSWEDGVADDVFSALEDAGVDGTIVYKAPLALMADTSGEFSRVDNESWDLSWFRFWNPAVSAKIPGLFHEVSTASTDQEITRIYVWENLDSDDDPKVLQTIEVDNGAGNIVLFDESEPVDDGYWSTTSPCDASAGLYKPSLEVPGLKVMGNHVGHFCMREVDLSAVGGSIPAGSSVSFRSTVIGGNGGIILDSYFQPVCADEYGVEGRCDMNVSNGWAFDSGVEIPDAPSEVASYAVDLLEAMLGEKK